MKNVKQAENADRRYTYNAFISYRRSDGTAAARWLWKKLLKLRLPNAVSKDPMMAGRPPKVKSIWMDRVYERATEDFYEKNVRPALLESEFMLVLASPDVVRPRPDGSENWVQREVADFLQTKQAANIILASTTGIESVHAPASLKAKFPRAQVVDLGRLSWTRFFWWPHLSRLRQELLVCLAALLHVPPELMPALREEERRAQIRALTALCTGALILVAVFAGLAIAYKRAANLAIQQQEKAEAEGRVSANGRAIGMALAAERHFEAKDDPATTVLLAAAQHVYLNPNVQAMCFRARPPSLIPGAPLRAEVDSQSPIALSHEGRWLAVGLTNGIVSVLDMTSGKEDRRFGPHLARAHSLAFSADDRLLAVGAPLVKVETVYRTPSTPATIEVWDFRKGQSQSRLVVSNIMTTEIQDLAFGGTNLVAGLIIGKIFVWEGGKLLWQSSDNQTVSIVASKWGHYLAAAQRSGVTRIYSYDGHPARDPNFAKINNPGAFSRPNRLKGSFGDNFTLFAAGTLTGSVHWLYRWYTSSGSSEEQNDCHSAEVTGVTWLGTNGALLSGSWDRSICLIDTWTNQLLARASGYAEGIQRLQASDDGQTVVIQDYAGVIRPWRVARPQYDGLRSTSGTLRGYDATGQKLMIEPRTNSPPHPPLLNRILETNSAAIWVDEQTEQTTPISTPRGPAVALPQVTPMVQGGQYLFVSSSNGWQVWDSEAGKALKRPPEANPLVGYPAVSADGRSLAWSSFLSATNKEPGTLPQSELRVYDLGTERFLQLQEPLDTLYGSISFSADGSMVAAATLEGAVDSWDLGTGKKIRLVTPIFGAPAMVQFLPFGQQVIVAELVGQIKVIDARDPVQTNFIQFSTSDDGQLTALALHPDGRLVATAAINGGIWLFDLETRAQLARFNPGLGRIDTLSFRPDGRVLAVGAADGRILLLGGHIPGSVADATKRTGLQLDENSFEISVAPPELSGSGWPFDARPPQPRACREDDVKFWRIYQQARQQEYLKESGRGDLNTCKRLAHDLVDWSKSHPESGLAPRALDESARLGKSIATVRTPKDERRK